MRRWHTFPLGYLALVMQLERPMPPAELADQIFGMRLMPSEDLKSWVWKTFIEEGGPLHNPDHMHLLDASIGFMWASSGFERAGKRVAGMAEDLRLGTMGHAWKRARTDQQFVEWFGDVPDFLITVDAFHWQECTDADACALIEHELFHIAHEHDEFGSPKYTKEGMPRLRLVSHDVEEFVGVVRRYGIGDPDSSLARMVIAAAEGPTLPAARISQACGNCVKA